MQTYSTGWVDSPYGSPDYDKYSGYSTPDFASSHQTNGSASFDFAFNGELARNTFSVSPCFMLSLGTGIFVFGTRRSNGGSFTVTLSDITPEGNVTLLLSPALGTNQASTTLYQSLLYSQTGLKVDTPHNIHVANTGQGEFDFDFILVETEVGSPDSTVHSIVIDDTNPAFTYSGGSWNQSVADPNSPSTMVTKYWNNGTEHRCSDIGAKAVLDFSGTGVVGCVVLSFVFGSLIFCS